MFQSLSSESFIADSGMSLLLGSETDMSASKPHIFVALFLVYF